MKKIGKFLFVEQRFADIEETKPCIIHIDAFENLISEEEEWQSIK